MSYNFSLYPAVHPFPLHPPPGLLDTKHKEKEMRGSSNSGFEKKHCWRCRAKSMAKKTTVDSCYSCEALSSSLTYQARDCLTESRGLRPINEERPTCATGCPSKIPSYSSSATSSNSWLLQNATTNCMRRPPWQSPSPRWRR